MIVHLQISPANFRKRRILQNWLANRYIIYDFVKYSQATIVTMNEVTSQARKVWANSFLSREITFKVLYQAVLVKCKLG